MDILFDSKGNAYLNLGQVSPTTSNAETGEENPATFSIIKLGIPKTVTLDSLKLSSTPDDDTEA